jgi:NarL family two-component system sensor histidine kinase LiaS
MSLMAEQIQNLLQTSQDLAALEERNRLARDLHDSVKQQVFATSMTLGTAKTFRDKDNEGAWEKIDEALNLSLQAQEELTGLIHELRPAALEGRELTAALDEYSTRWSYQTGIEVSGAIKCERTIPDDVEHALFRLAQEALSNVSRHSQAKGVEISLQCVESVITLEFSDDGVGFDTDSIADRGMGLNSMQERIEALGGELIIVSEPGEGTRLIARCTLE